MDVVSVMRKCFYGCFVLLILLLSACGAAAQTAQPTRLARAVKPLPTATPTQAPVVVPTPTPISLTTPTPAPTVGIPTRLVIPAIGVDAPVERVGITDKGELATPQDPWHGVGWYQLGPRPGELGSAVIDGHVNWTGGDPSVFHNLHRLHQGDSVMVTDDSGRTLHFQVLRVETYPPSQAPVQEIFGGTGGTFLNLLTCAGDWIPSQQQTSLRLVVYTSLVQ